MTLVLTVISPNVVLQASDRRVTYVKRGVAESWDDQRNKAVLYCNRVAFAYTGVAELGTERTDEWIAFQLADHDELGTGLEHLRERATLLFRGPRLRGQPLTIVGAGWIYEPPHGQLRGFATTISNVDPDRGVTDRFSLAYELAPDGKFGLFTHGRFIPSPEFHQLRRNLVSTANRSLNVMTAMRLLVEAIRSRAAIDHLVGRDVLINCLPRTAAHPVQDVIALHGQSHPDVPTFLHVPDGTDDPIRYGPTFVCGGTVMADFETGPIDASDRPRDESVVRRGPNGPYYYLARYTGHGTRDMPFRPVGSEHDGWTAIDLRGDCTVADGYALLSLPIFIEDAPGLLFVTDDADADLTPGARSELEERLGVALPPGPRTFREIVARLLTDLAGGPPEGWNPVRPASDGKIRIYLGGGLFYVD